jgi:hypothetical protein
MWMDGELPTMQLRDGMAVCRSLGRRREWTLILRNERGNVQELSGIDREQRGPPENTRAGALLPVW